MMRYVKYAKEAKLSIYSPNFSRKRTKRHFPGQPTPLAVWYGTCPSAAEKGESTESVSAPASEAELVPSEAKPEAMLLLTQGTTDEALNPMKPQSYKGKEVLEE
ncbi:hypothetical protein CFOL_v3_29009 [Cephalotus follicularis]|uniref:Uncharacterized protein n=1 Tax=Cephalotus follicularis TaxID=3775 RepID=A0A1Q3CZT4_CEPFO|nr:hypothetical protein CFOL_v3_29009 [Cephalotus follicularis]